VRNSEVANCIILENTVIENVGQRIEDSLIGRNVTVNGNSRCPAATGWPWATSARCTCASNAPTRLLARLAPALSPAAGEDGDWPG
jgi:NDP-sugar pyrophosphorylase family protein